MLRRCSETWCNWAKNKCRFTLSSHSTRHEWEQMRQSACNTRTTNNLSQSYDREELKNHTSHTQQSWMSDCCNEYVHCPPYSITPQQLRYSWKRHCSTETLRLRHSMFHQSRAVLCSPTLLDHLGIFPRKTASTQEPPCRTCLRSSTAWLDHICTRTLSTLLIKAYLPKIFGLEVSLSSHWSQVCTESCRKPIDVDAPNVRSTKFNKFSLSRWRTDRLFRPNYDQVQHSTTNENQLVQNPLTREWSHCTKMT